MASASAGKEHDLERFEALIRLQRKITSRTRVMELEHSRMLPGRHNSVPTLTFSYTVSACVEPASPRIVSCSHCDSRHRTLFFEKHEKVLADVAPNVVSKTVLPDSDPDDETVLFVSRGTWCLLFVAAIVLV